MHPTLLVLALATILPAQEPDAAALFRRAVEVQTPGGTAPKIADFQADLNVSIFEKGPDGRTSTKTGKVTEFWKEGGGRDSYHRILSVAGSATTHLCTNGKSMLMWEDEGTGSGPARDLLANPALAKDRQQLQDELHRTRELLNYFFLSSLDGPGVTFSRAPDAAPITLDNGRTLKVVKIVRRKEKDPDVAITLGAEDFRVYVIDKAGSGPGFPPESFRFGVHRTRPWTDPAGKVRQILLPTLVEYFEAGERLLRAEAREPEDIKFNSGLTAVHFEPRRK